MQAVILAGGYGTRIMEESHLLPKPLIDIGGKPIIWHVMKMYSSFGIDKFIICCGYKGYLLKEYFANYYLHNSDISVELDTNTVKIHKNTSEPWHITLVDTGEATMTGGRIKRVEKYLDERFCLTYGDGLADVNISRLIKSHKKSGKLATVTAVQPVGRWGSMSLVGNDVTKFIEKPAGDGQWINGGFFICEKEVIGLINGDQTSWELEPLKSLANKNLLNAYKHRGFWSAMDTLRDKKNLEEMWKSGDAPWKTWVD